MTVELSTSGGSVSPDSSGPLGYYRFNTFPISTTFGIKVTAWSPSGGKSLYMSITKGTASYFELINSTDDYVEYEIEITQPTLTDTFEIMIDDA